VDKYGMAYSKEDAARIETEARVTASIVAFLRAPNEDGTPRSADREVLAQRIERLEHWK